MRKLILCGALAPFFYIAAAIIGWLLAPGYDHIRDSVSDLLRPGMPNKVLLDSLMFLSNIFIVIGSAAALIVHKKLNKPVNAGLIMILSAGILSTLSAHVFRLPMGPAMTLSGIIHIVIVALLAILSLTFILLIGYGMKEYGGWEKFKTYSIITFILFLIGGAISPIVVSSGLPLVGLVEKISVAIYFQWVIVFFIRLYQFKGA